MAALGDPQAQRAGLVADFHALSALTLAQPVLSRQGRGESPENCIFHVFREDAVGEVTGL